MELAFFLIIAGAVLLAGVYLFTRLRGGLEGTQPAQPAVPVNLASTSDAILVARGYGLITFANPHARQWFALDGAEPDLEMLAAVAAPPDTFRDLFAAEGRALLQIGQRRVEASSHRVPGEDAHYMVVVLRDLASARAEYDPRATQALVALSQVGELARANAPLADILNALLPGLRAALAFDAGQVLLRDPETGELRVQAQLGDLTLLRALAGAADYAGRVSATGEPLLVEQAGRAAAGSGGVADAAFESYIGVPLHSNGNGLGVLQLVKAEPGAFGLEALALAGAVADQASLALDRARVYRADAEHARQLAGLQAIAHVAAEPVSRRDLFAALSAQIATTLAVEQCGLFLHDPDGERLVAELPFAGLPDRAVALINFQLPADGIARRVWESERGWQATAADDEGLLDAIGLHDYRDLVGIRALALMPLLIGRRRIGLVLATNPEHGGAFSAQDMQRLGILADQAAVVVESIRLQDRERYHRDEFAALQAFSAELGQLPDEAAVYREAAPRIAALLRAEMAGVLLHDPARQALVAHPAFYGIDPGVLDYLQISIAPGTALAKRWAEEEGWLSADVRQDPAAIESGLTDLASWVGIRQVLLVPLVVRGQALGALLAGNKQGGRPFTRDDVRLATIFAAQLAVIRENAGLLDAVQTHAETLSTLRRVSDVLSQRLPLDRLLRDSLQEIAGFFASAIAFVRLLDETTGELRLLPGHVVGATLPEPLVVDAVGPGAAQSAVLAGQPMLNNRLGTDANLLPVYRPAVQALGLRQALIAPLAAGGEKLGELVVANPASGFYTVADLDRLVPLAAQLSVALERVRLMQTTDSALQRRMAELVALERVSSALSLTVALEQVTEIILQEAPRALEVSGCTLLLRTPQEEWADVDQPEMLRRHGEIPALAGEVPIEQQALRSGTPVLVADYSASDLQPEPVWAGSALAVPVLFGARMIGVLHIYDQRPGMFDEQAVTFGQAMALKAAAAYINAAQFREQISRNQLLSRRVEQLSQIFELGQVFRGGQSVERLLDAVAHAVHLSTGFSLVLISLYDEAHDGFRRVAQAGIPLATFEELRRVILSREQVAHALQDKFRISQSYFLPAEQQAEWAAQLRDDDFVYHAEYAGGEAASQRWQPNDALIVPLRDSQGRLLGIMSVDAPLDGRRPVRSTLEPLEIFAQQAAIAIENQRLLQAIQRDADVARRERDLLERLYAVADDIQRAADVPGRLQVVAQGIRSAGWGQVHISLRDANMDPTTVIAEGYSETELERLQQNLVPGAALRRWLSDPEFYELRLGTAFYLRHDAPWVIAHLRGSTPPTITAPADRWHPADQVILPIYGTDSNLIGLIGMEGPTNGDAPTEASMRPIALFAGQAANAIETTRLYQETRRAAEQEAFFNEMMREATSTLDANRIVRALADGLQRFVSFTTLTVAQHDPDRAAFATLSARVREAGQIEVQAGEDVPAAGTLLGEVLAEGNGRLIHLDANSPAQDDARAGWAAGERSAMFVPMMVGGRAVGVLRAASAVPHAAGFESGRLELVQRVANLGAVALENARLFADARHRAQELTEQTERLSLLNRVSTKLAQSLDIENIFEVALQESAAAVGVSTARAVLLDASLRIGRVVMDFPRGDAPPTDVIALDSPALVHLRQTLQPLAVEDVQQAPLLADRLDVFKARGVQSLLLVPLVIGRQAIGLLSLESVGQQRVFTREQQDLVQTIAGQAAIALQNANLLEQSYIRTRELETLFEASQAAGQSLDLDEVITNVARHMPRALGADRATVMLWDEVEQDLVVYADVQVMDGGQSPIPDGTTYPLAAYPLRRRVLEQREIAVIPADSAEQPAEAAEMAVLGSLARMLVPLVVRENAIGLVVIEQQSAYRSFGVSEQRIAWTLAGQAAIAIENARLSRETANQVREGFLINDLSRAVSAAVDLRELYPLVREQVPSLTRSEVLYLALYDHENDLLSFPVALADGQETSLPARPLGADEFSWVVRNNRPLLLAGEESVEVVRQNLHITSAVPEAACFLAVPLDLGFQAVGVLAVADRHRSRAFGLNEQRILTTVASQLAVAVQNASLFSELRRFNQELERRVQVATEDVRAERDRLNVLYTITAELSATLDLGRVLNRALDLLAQAIGAEQSIILLVDPEEQRLYRRAELGQPLAAPAPEGGADLDTALAAQVMADRQSLVIDDVHADPRWAAVAAGCAAEAHSALAVLLETGEEVLGVLLLLAGQPGVFVADHLRLVEAAGNQLAASINNAALYTFIREQAEQLGDMVREQQVETTKSNAILEGVADGVLVADEQGRVILVNNAAERVLDLRRTEVLEKPVERITGLFTRGGERWAATIADWVARPASVQAGETLNEVVSIDQRVINVTLAPVMIRDQFLGTVSVLRDITREVEVDRLKSEFISNVSHELRTPMTSIKGYSDLLLLGVAGDFTDRQREFLGTIKLNADRLGTLVDDFLNISQIDSNRLVLNWERVSIPALIGELLAALRKRITAEGRALSVVDDIPDGLPETFGDPDKLAQLLGNLLDNAYRYTPDGGTITVTARLDDAGQLLIAVRDTGIGIPEQLLPRVFERFFRNSEHPLVIETPGTGLGLALAQALAAMHAGRITVQSEVDRGSTFTLALPVLQEAPAGAAG